MLLIQYTQDGHTRVGVLDAENGQVTPLASPATTYELAQHAITDGLGLKALVRSMPSAAVVDYHDLAKAGALLPPLTHPDPAHCLVTGTGLTHLGSAESRNAMHKKLQAELNTEGMTDSMKMFQLGLEGGKPAAGAVGHAPEWFYKGDGSIMRAAWQAIEMPSFALDGGDEAEIAGLYVNGPDGTPHRVGYALGNEFSDHVVEQQNYLYLAHSKLRECAVGPALLVGELPEHVAGTSRVRAKSGEVRWAREFLSGENNMSHSIRNLEHHHFKYALFRRAGDVHVHFFGAAVLSFADRIKVEPGDRFEIESNLFGPALVNPLARVDAPAVSVKAL